MRGSREGKVDRGRCSKADSHRYQAIKAFAGEGKVDRGSAR